MDDEDVHTIPPNHIHIDPNQLEMMENLFQIQILEMERVLQEQLATERANWAQESKNQEAALEKQVDKLQQQLSDAQLYPSPKQRYTHASNILIVKSDFLYFILE